MVVVTTIITPVLLKLAFKGKPKVAYDDLIQSDLVEKYEEIEQLDRVDQEILSWEAENREMREEKKRR